MYLHHKRPAAAFVGGLLLAALAAPALATPGQTADQKPGTAAPAPPAPEKAPPPPAQTLVDAAVRTARTSGRTVLVHFGASW